MCGPCPPFCQSTDPRDNHANLTNLADNTFPGDPRHKTRLALLLHSQENNVTGRRRKRRAAGISFQLVRLTVK